MATNALSLFQIEDELQTWMNTLELVEGDETASAEIQQRVTEYLDKAIAKRDRVSAFLAHLEHLEHLAKSEEARLAARRKALAASRERLEAYAVAAMHALDVRRLQGNTSELRLAKNPDSVEILDQSKIPEIFMRQPYIPPKVPDKASIKVAIKAGEVVPGARLIIGGDRLERK